MWEEVIEAILRWMGNNAENARKVAGWTRLVLVAVDTSKRLKRKENEPTCKQVDSNPEKK